MTRRSTSGVIARRGPHLLRQSTSSKRDWTQWCEKRERRTHEGRMLRILCAKPLSMHTDSSSAKSVASRKGACKSTRHTQTRMLWPQERVAANHLRVVKVATESNPAVMLTKAHGRSKMEEFCEEIGQTEPHAKTVDKKPKDAKKSKTVNFAFDTNDEMIQNKLKDSRIAKIKNETKDA